ncbi:MAG: ATP-binding protein [Thermoplasmata archaeon]
MAKNILALLERQRLDLKSVVEQKSVPREVNVPPKILNSNLIKVITGPRRAGKSFFALQMLNEMRFSYVNFDDETLIKIKDYDSIIDNLDSIYGKTDFLLMDEIQNLPDWELFVNRLQRQHYNLILTGSNSKLLSKELATHLTGRHYEIQIYPFSYSEFLSAQKNDKRADYVFSKNKLEEYLLCGGYPEIIVKNMEYSPYLKTLVESVIFKDIVRRYDIRFSSELYELAKYLFNAFATELSLNRIAKMLEIGSVHTVKKYLDYLEEAYLIVKIPRYSFKYREIIKAPNKIYIIDNGIINAFSSRTTRDHGRIMENTVAIELLRRHGQYVFYWKDQYNREVDFVVKTGKDADELIQVTFASAMEDVNVRELRALVYASSILNCNMLKVITWDLEDKYELDGKSIDFVPLWKWLIQK